MTETIDPVTAQWNQAAPEAGAPSHRAPSRWRVPGLVAGLVAVAGGIPLAVALGVLNHPRWYPLLDLAQTELRVRDVGGRNTPLVGLAGRFDANGVQGSHLGPLSFWALWPFYKVFGSTAWALQAASACLNLLAMAAATWIAHRRGGPRAALAMAVALAVLGRTYGPAWLTEAWNPYMPMLWWVVFLLAVWSVLDDDLPMLPVAVFAGSFCLQTHIPYLGLVGGLGAFTAAVVGWRWLRLTRRPDPDAGSEAGSPRNVLGWGLASLALLAGLWTAPVVDQLVHEPGNMTVVRYSLTHSDDEPVGLGRAVEIQTSNLNPWVFVTGAEGAQEEAPSGVSVVGLVVLAVWAAAVALTLRGRHRPGYPALLRLHAVVGLALVLGLVSTSRILGFPWYYLVLWSLGTTMLLTIAVVWTAVLTWRDRVHDRYPYGPGPDGAVSRHQGLATGGTIALGALLAIVAVAFTYDASHAEVPATQETRTLRNVAPQVVEALEAGDAPGGGPEGRYLVRWTDDHLGIGAQGFGLLLELERQGFDVGVPPPLKTGAVAHRARELDESSATVNWVSGESAIALWEDRAGAVPVAYFEPRSEREVNRFERLRDEVVTGLQDEGLGDVVATVDANLFVAATDERVPDDLRRKLGEMMDLGLPTAVFVAPPEAG